MATYQRGAGAHVAERVQAEPGSDEEKRLEELVEDTSSGWRRVDEEAEQAPAKPKRSTRAASKE